MNNINNINNKRYDTSFSNHYIILNDLYRINK